MDVSPVERAAGLEVADEIGEPRVWDAQSICQKETEFAISIANEGSVICV